MTLEEARTGLKPVVSVRPTKDGKWEVVKTTHTEDVEWQSDWQVWWSAVGCHLQVIHPSWWPK